MLFTLAFFFSSIMSAVMLYLHPPHSVALFYFLAVVIGIAIVFASFLMVELLNALSEGPSGRVRW